ncbi:sll0787 family AIR synthase-like protein [Alloalcanivorax mobilis]|uniref:sll0787 family AIR synthase-like protein n=1 Tax=Alloalcanivorax mobilis TaxID=2019569 RepID=UPI000C781A65|nr:sll0787 family AIR synthase-like protein [Alloalcanivorax mobilis]|tara:strand:- start:9797 stop:10795 length:999 start_codon:yes stop_codon:yes gene_type:complete
MKLDAIIRELRDSAAFDHKRDIRPILNGLAGIDSGALPLGDDSAALADGDGHLLVAIEGFLNEFVAAEPEFAGYCGVMVNVSDIYAMGGRPLAVVDALWSDGAARAGEIVGGLRQAAGKYGVPVVGGHSNTRTDRPQLSVAIVGRARALLTSFDARPGDSLIVACDARGRYRDVGDNWDASSAAPGERLRDDLEILPVLAEQGLCRAAKDISMAGVVGTVLMLLEASGVGAVLDLDVLPKPVGVPLARWLRTFPSYGFVLSVAPTHRDAVLAAFHQRDLAAAEAGRITAGGCFDLTLGDERDRFWDLSREPFIGRAASAASSPSSHQGGRHA